jgi:hypothetical protein
MMLKMIKKDVLLANNEGVQLLEFKNGLRSKFDNILMKWMKDRDDEAVHENFICWLSLSGPEIFMAFKRNEESGNMQNNLRSTYIALLRELAAVMKKGTGVKNVVIPDRCIECHDIMQVIIREYMESSNKLLEHNDNCNLKNYKELFQDESNYGTMKKKENGNSDSGGKKSLKEKFPDDEDGAVAINLLNISGEEEKEMYGIHSL